MDRLPIRRWLALLGVVLVASPMAIVIAILLRPFWSWWEATTGIEAIGHSGPAAWCYGAVWLLQSAAIIGVALGRGGAARPDGLPATVDRP
jgi:hypothetical protein